MQLTERTQNPAPTAALAVPSEQRDSFVRRGLVALRSEHDARYRLARWAFERKDGKINWNVAKNKGSKRDWNAADNPAIYSAFRILQQLADEHYGKAYYPLSVLYSGRTDAGDWQVLAAQYTRLALEWCLTNQADGDAELWCDLGDMHYPLAGGFGVVESKEIACSCYQKAAELGLAKGQWELGYMYHVGRGVEKSYEQAVHWYQKAAAQDGSGFQYDLGEMYLFGFGVAKSDEQAVYWYRKAAEQGDVRGQVKLGEMYALGFGVEKDDGQAVYWYRKAAEQGDTRALDKLAAMQPANVKNNDVQNNAGHKDAGQRNDGQGAARHAAEPPGKAAESTQRLGNPDVRMSLKNLSAD